MLHSEQNFLEGKDCHHLTYAQKRHDNDYPLCTKNHWTMFHPQSLTTPLYICHAG